MRVGDSVGVVLSRRKRKPLVTHLGMVRYRWRQSIPRISAADLEFWKQNINNPPEPLDRDAVRKAMEDLWAKCNARSGGVA